MHDRRDFFGDRFEIRPDMMTISLSNINPQAHLTLALTNFTHMERGETRGQSENLTSGVARFLESWMANALLWQGNWVFQCAPWPSPTTAPMAFRSRLSKPWLPTSATMEPGNWDRQPNRAGMSSKTLPSALHRWSGWAMLRASA